MNKMYNILVLYLCILTATTSSSKLEKLQLSETKKLAPCKSCKTLADSFQKGMQRTEMGKFEGGDAAWEEEKLGRYADSEVRLAEIQEHLCSELEKGKSQCYTLAEENEELIELWWLKHRYNIPELYQWLCIDTLKLCCPPLHFGPHCKPCPGFPIVCNNHGYCKGSGTRNGIGTCQCSEGYRGELCHECASNYYETYKDDIKVMCNKCHATCNGSCRQAGPKGCKACADGWIMDSERGCLDVNECASDTDICSPLQFCVNTDGSYKCLECDKACRGCTGDGPDMCTNCAIGFTNVNNVCIDAVQENLNARAFCMRYLTYLGLCIATCIIFQRSFVLASIVGLSVGVYISVSEYMLNTPPSSRLEDLEALLVS